jgi:peptidoglycan/LPS O-acetylase OafA/YrhL
MTKSQEDSLKKYEWIDFGRGIAILLVIFLHSSEIFNTTGFIKTVAGRGDMGVQLFFILSAFTLFNSYTNRYAKDGERRNLFFFIRRFFRISPLYYSAAIFYTAVAILTNGFHSVFYWQVLVNVLYLNGIVLQAINYIPAGGWSIGTEMLFYLLIPILFKKVRSLRSALWLLLAAILFSNLLNWADMTLITHYTNRDWSVVRNWYLYFWLPNQFPVFCFGILLFFFLKKYDPRPIVKRSCLLLSIILFLLCSQVNYSLAYPLYFFQREYVFSIVFFLFIIGIKGLRFDGRLGKFFLKIGQYSFCMYLFHWFFRNAFADMFFRYLGFKMTTGYMLIFYAAVVLVSFAGAAILHPFERKGIEWGNELIRKIGTKKQAEAELSVESPGI